MGRFQKPDSNFDSPLSNPQGWNLYSYVKGNPVNFNDPTGHQAALQRKPWHSPPPPLEPAQIKDSKVFGDDGGNPCGSFDVSGAVEWVGHQAEASGQAAPKKARTTMFDSKDYSFKLDPTVPKPEAKQTKPTISVYEVSGQGGNPFGHVTLSINNMPQVGFGPKVDLTSGQLTKELLHIDNTGTPGIVEPRAPNTTTLDSVTMHVTDKQAGAAQAYVDYRTAFPGNYHWTERNCANFVEDALGMAGIAVQRDVKPSALLEDLHKDQSAGTIPQ
jgi:hypothetical protein